MFFNRIMSQQEKQQRLIKIKQDLEAQKEKIKRHNEYVKLVRIYNKRNVLFPIKNEYNSIIPLNFYTCWHTKELPPLMKQNYDLLVKQNPEFNCQLFDESDCIEFIKQHFDSDVLNAYESLVPCSYKSDLWRFCVLYINGGIYMDIKYRCVNGFKLIALTEKEFFVRDRPEHMTYTALIVIKPNNNIMLKCINKIVENVNNKYYGYCALCPTGPGLLGSFFSLDEISSMEIFFTNTEFKNNITEDYMVYKDVIILKYYTGYRKEQDKYQKNKRYSEIWHNRKVYK